MLWWLVLVCFCGGRKASQVDECGEGFGSPGACDARNAAKELHSLYMHQNVEHETNGSLLANPKYSLSIKDFQRVCEAESPGAVES